jgi:hypothetical protein
MNMFDKIVLLLTGLTAIYALVRLWGRYSTKKETYDVYYLMGFVVLLISGLLLIFLGYGILGMGGTTLSPYILPVASLIPLGLSMGIAEQYYPNWKRGYKWFALVGFLAIAITSIARIEGLRKIAVPLFHGTAGLVIFLGPIFAETSGKSPKGFFWVGVGGILIGLGGIALAFLSVGGQLLFFSKDFVFTILGPLLLLMTLAFTWGFMKDLRG